MSPVADRSTLTAPSEQSAAVKIAELWAFHFAGDWRRPANVTTGSVAGAVARLRLVASWQGR